MRGLLAALAMVVAGSAWGQATYPVIHGPVTTTPPEMNRPPGPVLEWGELPAEAPVLPAQDIPDGLTPYAPYRAALLREGFTPTPVDEKSRIYEFPEVSCGNKICAATWQDRDGKAVSIVLWRGAERGDYRLAPDFDRAAN